MSNFLLEKKQLLTMKELLARLVDTKRHQIEVMRELVNLTTEDEFLTLRISNTKELAGLMGELQILLDQIKKFEDNAA